MEPHLARAVCPARSGPLGARFAGTAVVGKVRWALDALLGGCHHRRVVSALRDELRERLPRRMLALRLSAGLADLGQPLGDGLLLLDDSLRWHHWTRGLLKLASFQLPALLLERLVQVLLVWRGRGVEDLAGCLGAVCRDCLVLRPLAER